MKFCSLLGLFLFLGLGSQSTFVEYNATDVRVKKEGTLIEITLPFSIAEGYHIQDAFDTQDNVLPTKISFKESLQYKVVEYSYSQVNYDTVVLDKVSHKVMGGLMEVRVALEETGNDVGPTIFSGELFYQACNKRQCFFPRTLAFQVTL